jgi:hypothetical protein
MAIACATGTVEGDAGRSGSQQRPLRLDAFLARSTGHVHDREPAGRLRCAVALPRAWSFGARITGGA